MYGTGYCFSDSAKARYLESRRRKRGSPKPRPPERPLMIGDRIREVRNSRQLSLTDVAVKAGVSVATLSRIENNKQGLDLDLFMLLARILKTDPNDILDDSQRGAAEPIAQKINAL